MILVPAATAASVALFELAERLRREGRIGFLLGRVWTHRARG